MDRRFGQLHADMLDIIRNTPNAYSFQDKVTMELARRYGAEPSGVPQAWGELFETGCIEPINPTTGMRDAGSNVQRITSQGETMLRQWQDKPVEQRIKDSTPIDHQGTVLGAPVVPLAMQASQNGDGNPKKAPPAKRSQGRPKPTNRPQNAPKGDARPKRGAEPVSVPAGPPDAPRRRR